MKAAVLWEPKTSLKIENLEIDEPRSTEVMIKLAASGICHTDLGPMHGIMPVPLPAVLGHEIAGVVEKVGDRVVSVKPGDHVLCIGLPPCGRCIYCKTGRETLCQTGLMVAFQGLLPEGETRLRTTDGKMIHHFLTRSSFAEYAVVPEAIVVKVRNDAPLDKIVLLGCGAATGISAVLNTAHPRVGETMAILGCGGLGLAGIMAADLAGVGELIAIDVSESKLEMARELGATHIINAAKEDPVARVKEITGFGVDYAVEMTGNNDVMSQAYEMIGPGGFAIICGMAPSGSKVSLNATGQHMNMERKLMGVARGSLVASRDLPRWVDFYMKGRLPLDKLITNTYGLDEVGKALEDLDKGVGLRSVITF